MRHLGRRAELPQLLRGVRELPPAERGAVGKAANEARVALEGLIEARARRSWRPRSWSASLQRDRVDVTLPGAPPQPSGAPARAHEHPRRAGGHLRRARLHRDGRARGRDRALQLRRAQPLARPTPRGRARTRSTCTRPPGGEELRAAHAHLADAGARDGGPPAAAVRGDPRPGVPARHRRHAHAAVPPDRGARRRRGHHARRPQGHAARVRARGLRRGARGAPAPPLLPLHRAVGRGGRLLLSLRRQGLPARRRALLPVQGRGVAGGARRRRGGPQRLLLRPHHRAPTPPGTTPSACRASRGGWGSSGSRCSSTGSPTCGCTSKTISGSWSSSDDASPSSGCANTATPTSTCTGSRSA